jgi:hypothetical protein
MLPLIPLVFVGLAGGAGAYALRKKERGLTPARAKLLEGALTSLPDPAKLRELAAAYRAEGLTAEADLLEKRAALKERTPEKKKEHREVVQRALVSENPKAVEGVASAFHGMGATGTAANLRRHARALKRLGS